MHSEPQEPESVDNAVEKKDAGHGSPRANAWHAIMQGLMALFSERNPSAEEVRAMSGKLAELYPEYAESIAALVDLPRFFETDRDVNESKMLEKMGVMTKERKQAEQKRRHKLIYELTQFQFLLTDIVVRSADDEQYLGQFWNVANAMAKADRSEGEMGKLRDAVLSQAAIYQLFKELGKEPRLSHPTEDADYAVDLWTDDHQAIQVKGAPKYETFEVVPTVDDTISFPGVALDEENKVKHYNSYISHERQYMRGKLSQYRKMEGKDVEGFLVVVPRNKRNPITAKPDQEIIDAARKTLGFATKGAALENKTSSTIAFQ